MKREIKFRAWDREKKCMRKIIQILWGSEMNPYPLSIDFYDSIKSKLFEDIELMQYTGLKDKNGKEIYEGDIVRGVGWVGIHEVRYNNDCWNEGYHLSGFEYPSNAEQIEIIGNIYENNEHYK